MWQASSFLKKGFTQQADSLKLWKFISQLFPTNKIGMQNMKLLRLLTIYKTTYISL